MSKWDGETLRGAAYWLFFAVLCLWGWWCLKVGLDRLEVMPPELRYLSPEGRAEVIEMDRRLQDEEVR